MNGGAKGGERQACEIWKRVIHSDGGDGKLPEGATGNEWIAVNHDVRLWRSGPDRTPVGK